MYACSECRYCDRDLSDTPCNECTPVNSNFTPKSSTSDTISKPAHYTGRGGIEPIEFITTNNLNFLEGNVVKYVYRYPFKNGLEDLKKARRNLDILIQQVEKDD